MRKRSCVACEKVYNKLHNFQRFKYEVSIYFLYKVDSDISNVWKKEVEYNYSKSQEKVLNKTRKEKQKDSEWILLICNFYQKIQNSKIFSN